MYRDTCFLSFRRVLPLLLLPGFRDRSPQHIGGRLRLHAHVVFHRRGDVLMPHELHENLRHNSRAHRWPNARRRSWALAVLPVSTLTFTPAFSPIRADHVGDMYLAAFRRRIVCVAAATEKPGHAVHRLASRAGTRRTQVQSAKAGPGSPLSNSAGITSIGRLPLKSTSKHLPSGQSSRSQYNAMASPSRNPECHKPSSSRFHDGADLGPDDGFHVGEHPFILFAGDRSAFHRLGAAYPLLAGEFGYRRQIAPINRVHSAACKWAR